MKEMEYKIDYPAIKDRRYGIVMSKSVLVINKAWFDSLKPLDKDTISIGVDKDTGEIFLAFCDSNSEYGFELCEGEGMYLAFLAPEWCDFWQYYSDILPMPENNELWFMDIGEVDSNGVYCLKVVERQGVRYQ